MKLTHFFGTVSLALMSAGGKPIQLQRYESRFRKSLFPDIVHLMTANYDLQIPEEWKQYRGDIENQ